MNIPDTLLKWDLARTFNPEEARFVDRKRKLRLFTSEIHKEAEVVFDDDRGRSFMEGKPRSVIFRNGRWEDSSLSCDEETDGLLFARDDGFWKCQYGGNTIKIMESCDPRDAAQWVNSYIDTCTQRSTGSNKRNLISEFKGVTYELGSVLDEDPMAVAQMEKDTIWFYNHTTTNRLFCVAVQEVTTSPWFKGHTPTTISDVIVHECAHLLEGQLKNPIADLAVSLGKAFDGDDGLFKELESAAMQVNEVYFKQLFRKTQIGIDCSKSDDRSFNLLAGADNVAREMVAEFVSRAVLGGQNIAKISENAKAKEIFDMIAKVPIAPENIDLLEGSRRVFSTNFMPRHRTVRAAFE